MRFAAAMTSFSRAQFRVPMLISAVCIACLATFGLV
jgi:hypothetical protein